MPTLVKYSYRVYISGVVCVCVCVWFGVFVLSRKLQSGLLLGRRGLRPLAAFSAVSSSRAAPAQRWPNSSLDRAIEAGRRRITESYFVCVYAVHGVGGQVQLRVPFSSDNGTLMLLVHQISSSTT